MATSATPSPNPESSAESGAEPSADDEFSAAFAELQSSAAETPSADAANPAESAEAAPAGTAAPAADAAPAGAAPAAGSGTAAPAVAGATAPTPPTKAGEPAPESGAGNLPPGSGAGSSSAAPGAAAEPASAPDYTAQLAALRDELTALKKAPPAATPPPAPAPEAPPVYSPDEQTALTKYQEEWPDVARGEALARRAEYQQLVGYVFETLRPTLAALQESSQSTTSRTQYTDLKRLVDDYDQVREPALAWVATQPSYLKAAYEQVASRGSPEEVADLITRFKKETNYVSAGVAPAAAAPAAVAAGAVPAALAAPAAGLAPAAAAAAASLRVVKSSRSEPVSAPDPNDFDGAFAEFASKA